MRNGNSFAGSHSNPTASSSYPTYEEWKRISRIESIIIFIRFLSYLWGMETPTPYTPHIPAGFCSYPTYEEWKRGYTASNIFYPTFLSYLWGMETNCNHLLNRRIQSSYPTYEEWKLSIVNQPIISFRVLILPMRNGNTF